MGRILQSQVQDILVLAKQGFTNFEIAQKVGVSADTVAKYRLDKPRISKSELEVLWKHFFGLLHDLESTTVSEPEQVYQIFQERALKAAEDLFALNKALGRSMLESHVEHLKSLGVLDLTVFDDELDADDLHLRKKWVKLLELYYPQKLADLT